MSARVVHFEIPFENGDRAREFYRQVFDWSLQSMPDMGYTMVSTGPQGDDGMPADRVTSAVGCSSGRTTCAHR